MESFKKAILLASTIIAVLAAEDGLEEKFELMISEISQLKTGTEDKFELMSSQILQLKTDNLRLTTELETLNTLTAFDCHSWSSGKWVKK